MTAPAKADDAQGGRARRDTSSDSRFSLRARPVAGWSLAFSFSCLTTLAIVLATGDDDLLATVALALAILAFALQIAFFMVQLRVAADQDRRSADLYRDTDTVLTKIDERSAATVAVIREQFDFVLRHALGRSSQDAGVLSPPPSIEGDPEADLADEDDRSDSSSDEAQPREVAAATVAEVEAIVNRAVRENLAPDVLARWREISTPPQEQTAALRSAAMARHEAAEFAHQVERVLRAGLGNKRAEIRRLNALRSQLLIEVDGLRCLVVSRHWSDPRPTQVFRQAVVAIREKMAEKAADRGVIVVPVQVDRVLQPDHQLFLHSVMPAVEFLSIDDLADKIARGWPGKQQP